MTRSSAPPLIHLTPKAACGFWTEKLGRGVIKISAVKPEHQNITAPAKVFDSQDALYAAFEAGELNCDFVAVLRCPRAER